MYRDGTHGDTKLQGGIALKDCFDVIQRSCSAAQTFHNCVYEPRLLLSKFLWKIPSSPGNGEKVAGGPDEGAVE